MSEQTTIIVEGEDACKLFNCFVAYNKLNATGQMLKAPTESDGIQIGPLPSQKEVIVELQENKNQ